MPYINRSATWPDPRVKPPLGAAEINWQHPLTQGLLAFWLFNEGGGTAVDLCFGLSATQVGGAAMRADTGGVGIFNTTVGTGVYYTAVRPAYLRTATSSTVARIRSSTSTPIATVACATFSSGQVPMIFTIDGPTILGYGFYDGAFHTSGINTVVNGDGLVHDVAGTYDGTTLTYYLDGKSDSTASYTGAQDTTQTVNLDFMQYQFDGRYFLGSIYHLAYYGRSLTAAEARWWASEPYAVCQPIVRRRYVIPVAGFKPAWAVQATRIVDAGSPYVP